MTTTVPFRITRPGADVMASLEVFEEDGAKVCGIFQIDGTIALPPKMWVAAVRAEVGTLEGIARDAGCVEMRIAGRDWSRVLPDYERFDGVRNGLRKVL